MLRKPKQPTFSAFSKIIFNPKPQTSFDPEKGCLNVIDISYAQGVGEYGYPLILSIIKGASERFGCSFSLYYIIPLIISLTATTLLRETGMASWLYFMTSCMEPDFETICSTWPRLTMKAR